MLQLRLFKNLIVTVVSSNKLQKHVIHSSKACKGVACWFHKECSEIKRTVTFKRFIKQDWNFVGIQVFERTFYSLNQSSWSYIYFKIFYITKQPSKLPGNTTFLNFRCPWYSHQTFTLFDLNANFPKLT